MKKRILALVLALAMAASLCACGQKETGSTAAATTKAAENPTKPSQVPGSTAAPSTELETKAPDRKIKQTLTVTLAGEPSNLNPHAAGQLNAYIVNYLIYDTLCKKDGNGQIVPGLAESWDLVDDTHIRFHIRQGVTFSNGTKMTAEDVLYTLQKLPNESTTKSNYSWIDADNCKMEDEYTVILAMKRAFAPAYDFLCHTYSSIVCKSYYEQVGKDEYGINPIGTGAYYLEKWTSGASILVKRNENYWGEKGASEYINVKIIAEQSNRAMELETGGTDIALTISANDAARIDQNAKLDIVTKTSSGIFFLGLNQKTEEMKNEKVRQALALALDVPTICKVVWGDYAEVATGPLPMAVAEYTAAKTYEYNVEKAKALLKEAGYENGINISARVKNDAVQTNIATIVANMWSKAGITCSVDTLDSATFSAKGKENVYNITVTSNTSPTGTAHGAVGTLYSMTSTAGTVSSTDQTLEDKITAASTLYDFDARVAAYAEINQYIVDNVYIIPIGFNMQVYGVAKNVVNFDANASNTPNLCQCFCYED